MRHFFHRGNQLFIGTFMLGERGGWSKVGEENFAPCRTTEEAMVASFHLDQLVNTL